MRIMILGGDGFCGWPTALHLSNHGHHVLIVDNFSRRRIDDDLEIQSLTPIVELEQRISTWEQLTKKRIMFQHLDIAVQSEKFTKLVASYQPDVIVHLAEQRSAPFSMKSVENKRYTIDNNVNGTHNVLSAMVESGLDIHLVHLGTMGVYGYGTEGMALPEGYVRGKFIYQIGEGDYRATDVQEFRYPSNPGSVYHMTKCLDAEMFAFYAKNDKLRITDLHQGIIWGTNTEQTSMHPDLINRFDYDGDYGTVLNRFLVESAIDFPLTVHGTGGQTRAFIHIQNSVQCIELAIQNPPERGDRVKIFNQMTETHRIIDLAERISQLSDTEIALVDNPRNEAPENELRVQNTQFLNLGLDPITLEDGLLSEIAATVQQYADRIDETKIPCTSLWSAR